jgi:hypothetical protein
MLLDLVRSLDSEKVDALIARRSYEALDLLIMKHLLSR